MSSDSEESELELLLAVACHRLLLSVLCRAIQDALNGSREAREWLREEHLDPEEIVAVWQNKRRGDVL